MQVILVMAVIAYGQVFERDLIQLPSKLREKVYALPGIMQASRADSTINKYCNSFLRFKKWAKEQGIEESELFPSKPLHVSIYLACLVQRANSPSPIVDAFYGIKWAHDLVGFNSTTDNQFVKNIMEGGKRIVAKPVQKKEPITVENLRSGIQDDSEEYVFCAISKLWTSQFAVRWSDCVGSEGNSGQDIQETWTLAFGIC
nr:uncharacterized protein LOC117689158 [Crassostrea gigas]